MTLTTTAPIPAQASPAVAPATFEAVCGVTIPRAEKWLHIRNCFTCIAEVAAATDDFAPDEEN